MGDSDLDDLDVDLDVDPRCNTTRITSSIRWDMQYTCASRLSYFSRIEDSTRHCARVCLHGQKGGHCEVMEKQLLKP